MKAFLLRALDRARLLGPAFRVWERVHALRGREAPMAADDGLPVPPIELIVRVAWSPHQRWFLDSGRRAAESIAAALERAGRPVESLGAMLDFGCGCGRVSRRWAGLDGVAVHGSDTNADAVEWCRANLPGTYEVNAPAPPLPHADGSFDAVYALSVLTHLPEEAGLAWRDELRRVLRPGGLLLVSTHGDAYRDKLAPAELEEYDRGELVVRWPSTAGTNLCAVYHPEPYLRGRLAEGFELVELVPSGATGNPKQDLTVYRKT